MSRPIPPDDRAFRLGGIAVSEGTLLLCVALFVGIGTGYGGVWFRWMIDRTDEFATDRVHHGLFGFLGPPAVIATLALGGALTAGIVRFASEAKGSGVPEVMEALALRGGIISARVLIVRAVASAVCIGFGGSCGREGPVIHIGAGIGSLVGTFSRLPKALVRTLVACGAAGGISASFNAPIGGVFFASEVILGDFAPRSFAAIVISSVLAAVIGRAYLGNHPSFSAEAFYLVSPMELAPYAVLGVLSAFWAAGFVKLLYGLQDQFERLVRQPIVRAVSGFAMVGLVAVWYPQILGVGYSVIQQVLSRHVGASKALTLAILKPLTTSLTLGSGGSGGVIGPLIFTGAMLGDAFGSVVHQLAPSWTATAAAYGLVGMAAVFGAAIEAPITAITIVFEMSSDYTIVLPAMVCTVIASLLGRKLIRSTIFELSLLRKGIDWASVRG